MEFDPPASVDTSRVTLSDGWRTVSFITWVLAGASLAAVAITSRTIGRSIWWLGPESNPASPVFLLIPLLIIGVPLVVTSKLPRHITTANIACSTLLIATSLGDIGSSPAVAAAVAVVGVLSMSVSVSLLFVARQYR
jgi:hypothetical protein